MAKLLVVGSLDGYRDLLLHALTGNEFDVILAKNANDAIEKSVHEAPDLVLLDGFDVLRSVKQNPITRDIPVVMISGTLTVTGEQDAMRLGVNHYMIKPLRDNFLSLLPT